VIPVDTRRVSAFLSSCEPVFFEDLEDDVSPKQFFRGDTSSFKPFKLGWHFSRKEIQDVVDSVVNRLPDNDTPRVIRISGNPGTGRTFTILAAVYRLIKEHRALAIKLSSYTAYPVPPSDILSSFVEEIEKGTEKINAKSVERVVFWSDFPVEDYDLSQFVKLTKEFKKYPVCLIAEELESEYICSSETIIRVGIDTDLSTMEKNDLAEYILSVTRIHRFPEISIEEIETIVAEEKTFLPIMYRSLDPTRRSIKQIIGEYFKEVSDPVVSTCISMCAMSSSMEMEMPVAVLRKALSMQTGCDYSYSDVFEIINKAGAFVKKSIDSRTNTLVSIYHSLVARIIIGLVGWNKIRENVLNISKTVDLRSRIEADFTGNLLIKRGVNWKALPHSFKPFDDDMLELALIEIKNRQPARPILHHLARFYAKKDIKNSQILPLLIEAMAESKEDYALEERKENVLTTLANVKWTQNKERLLSLRRDDAEISNIMEMLVRARLGQISNAHSFDIQARILKELAQNIDDPTANLRLLNEAMEVLTDGLNSCIEDLDGKQRLATRLIEIANEVNESEAEKLAEQMLLYKRDGTGYYTLAMIKYHDNKFETANQFLEKALAADNCPPGAIALQIEILLTSSNPDYSVLTKLSDRLRNISDFRDNWKSAYHRAVISVIAGRYQDALFYFKTSHKQGPRLLQRQVQVFWMEGGRRKAHTGKIGRTLTEREGNIYSHGISGWGDNIFFDPRGQKFRNELRTGLFVDFELGFSPRGPIAFDLRLH